MDYPVRADLQASSKFPNIQLPDHTGTPRKLSELLRGFSGVLIFNRGHYCPKDRRQLTNCVTHLQSEFLVTCCKMITVSVDDQLTTNEVRDALGTDWPLLVDADRRLLQEMRMVDTTDPIHGGG